MSNNLVSLTLAPSGNYEMYRATTTAAIREPNVAPVNTPEDCSEDGKMNQKSPCEYQKSFQSICTWSKFPLKFNFFGVIVNSEFFVIL